MGDAFKRQVDGIQNFLKSDTPLYSSGDSSSRSNHERDRAKRLEMNTELPNKAKEAAEAVRVVASIGNTATVSDFGDYLSYIDSEVKRAIETAKPIRDYYKTYQRYLNMDDNSFQKLTGKFTRLQEAWEKEKPSNRSEEETELLKSQLMEATLDFLTRANKDLQRRLNPGADVRLHISIQEEHQRETAMAQRWSNLFEKKKMVGAKAPDYKSKSWGNFISEKYDIMVDDLVKKEMVDPNSKDVDLVADIAMGGKNHDIRDEDERDTPKYENYMEYMYSQNQAFLEEKHIETAMAQRWSNLFEKKKMVGAKAPDYKGPKWEDFVSTKHDTMVDDLVKKKRANPNSRDIDLIEDIMAGGKNPDISDDERDTPKYERYMTYIYSQYQAFLKAQKN